MHDVINQINRIHNISNQRPNCQQLNSLITFRNQKNEQEREREQFMRTLNQNVQKGK